MEVVGYCSHTEEQCWSVKTVFAKKSQESIVKETDRLTVCVFIFLPYPRHPRRRWRLCPWRTSPAVLSKPGPGQLQSHLPGHRLHRPHLHWSHRQWIGVSGSGTTAQDAHLAKPIHHKPRHLWPTALLLHHSFFIGGNFYQIMALR